MAVEATFERPVVQMPTDQSNNNGEHIPYERQLDSGFASELQAYQGL